MAFRLGPQLRSPTLNNFVDENRRGVRPGLHKIPDGKLQDRLDLLITHAPHARATLRQAANGHLSDLRDCHLNGHRIALNDADRARRCHVASAYDAVGEAARAELAASKARKAAKSSGTRVARNRRAPAEDGQ